MHVNPAEDSHECEAIFSMEMKENTKEALSLSKNINSSLVLVQPRNTHPSITERLLMGRKESNQQTKEASATCIQSFFAH